MSRSVKNRCRCPAKFAALIVALPGSKSVGTPSPVRAVREQLQGTNTCIPPTNAPNKWPTSAFEPRHRSRFYTIRPGALWQRYGAGLGGVEDRKSTRLNSSHLG